MMFAPILVGLICRFTFGEVVQREHADHADDNCGEHDLRNGPILKKQFGR